MELLQTTGAKFAAASNIMLSRDHIMVCCSNYINNNEAMALHRNEVQGKSFFK